MEAIKFSMNSDFKNNVEEARIFFEDLGKQKYGANFKLNNNIDGLALAKLKEHFEKFSFMTQNHIVPEKGLLIVSSIENNAVIFIELLERHLRNIFKRARNTNSPNLNGFSVQYYITLNIHSTRDLVIELIGKKKIDDFFLTYNPKYLCLYDFGQEQITTLDYHNKVDISAEIIRKRFAEKRDSKKTKITYLITALNANELFNRYGKETLFHINKLCDYIILDNPKS